MEKAAYFTVSKGSKLGATATRVSRGSGAALGADSTSKFSRAVSSRTKTQEIALIDIAGCLDCKFLHVDFRRLKVTVVINHWQCGCLDGRLLVEEGGGQEKRHGGGGGRRVVGRGVRLEQREGAVMVRGVSSLDSLLVLKRTR